jgi:Glycosyltransferase like family
VSKTHQRAPVSIVCVSNNPEVLHDCLIRSVETHLPTAPKTELIVVQNSQREFPTAGAGLNYGVSQARNDVCVLVHQDVYLHSLVRIEEAAAALLTDTRIGLLGALGITPDRGLLGQIRDRVVLIGHASDVIAEVDSLDEVLFMARRDQLLQAPISEHPMLAWHAYAVEYGARMRRAGKRVAVGRIPLTHNSLTTNLERLTDAHAHVGLLYQEQLPIATTCGVIDGASAKRRKFLAGYRWRYRWLKGSRQAYSARRAVGQLPVVLSDIRVDIDRALDECGEKKLIVIALDSAMDVDGDLAEAIELERLGRHFAFRVANSDALHEWVANRGRTESLLLTNLDNVAFLNLRSLLSKDDSMVGFTDRIGFWLIVGPVAKASTEAWRLPSAKPLGLQAVH